MLERVLLRAISGPVPEAPPAAAIFLSACAGRCRAGAGAGAAGGAAGRSAARGARRAASWAWRRAGSAAQYRNRPSTATRTTRPERTRCRNAAAGFTPTKASRSRRQEPRGAAAVSAASVARKVPWMEKRMP